MRSAALLGPGGLALLLALVGCTQADQSRMQQQAQGAGQQVQQAAAQAGRAAADVALAAKVKAAIATRKGMEGSHVDVDAHQGAVTLKGTVQTRAQADEADSVARETAGVTAVTDQLNLLVPAKEGAPATGGTAPQ